MEHSNEDMLFLHSVPTGVLNEFRSEMYSGAYIRKNAAMFVDTAWVKQENQRVERASVSTAIKKERDASPCLLVKQEPASDTPTFGTATSSLFRSITENGHEVLELYSSDDEDAEKNSKGPLGIQAEDMGMSSDTMVGDITMDSDDDEFDPHIFSHCVKKSQANTSDMDSTASDSGDESDNEAGGTFDGVEPTVWLDASISSTIRHYGQTNITRQSHVSVVEYLSDLPSYWPVPRDSRAFILDLSDPKFNIEEKPGKLMTPDALFKNAQQDSWNGPTGNNDSRPSINTSVFGLTDGGEVKVRRTRLKCGGFSACEHVNPALLNHERYELDPESLQDVLKIQIDSRLREADTPEKHALIFFAVCHSNLCTAQKGRGQSCKGVPKLVKFKNNALKNGHQYFVSCSEWSSHFSEGHRTSFIPSGVRDEHLLTLFSGGNLPGFDEPLLCGRIVSAHIGRRISNCNFPHFGNGLRAKLVQHNCPASLTGFIPEDKNYPELSRMMCIVFHEDCHPHNHPILPPTKTPATIKESYRDCIKKAGIVGCSVRTIDNARTTKLALGSSPSLYNPTLQNNRVKQDIIRDVKKKTYPCGTDLPGVIHRMEEDLGKPIDERYIFGLAVTKNGGRIVVTANPFLLSRIHHAKTIFVDTTFKRTVSTLKEWEVVMYDKAVERALTIARVYTDRADRLQYKTIFDELQRVTFQVTGQHLRLKRLSKDGTLVSIGVDMELAQALGAGDSFLPTNDPEFSNINAQTAEEIVEYFVRSCYTHAKRGVHDLRTYVNDEAYDRLMNFLYLETKEEVDNFSAWVKGLKIPKVQAWWDHKVNNSWILPSLIKCLSKMDSEDWDLTAPTTNVGESQHHWTNINTGVMLSLLEAILTARELDEKVAAEVNATLSTTGVLKSTRNDTFTRMARSTARATHAYTKVKETRHRKQAVNVVDSQLASLKESQKENSAKIKELKAAKSKLTSHSGKSSKAESSSSGKIAITGMSRKRRADAAEKVAIVKKAADDRKNSASTSNASSTPNAATNCNFGESAAPDANTTFTSFDWPENGMHVFDFYSENSFEGAGWTEAVASLTHDVSMPAAEPQMFLPERISHNIDLVYPLADVTAAVNFYGQTPIVSNDLPPMDSFGLDSHTEALFDSFLDRFNDQN
ncbi:hypothetical protein BDN70DRAFT_984560 [Pholiota conissans]|uniref:Uncharacterized protein n=1 Tax=Pholiota conissans TaxID=109636 RepID=A0A9P5Z0J2_9AGAR|nr:hypothetical protein BDN70DRAFT_984560 [Pholiota conissans]